jgi:hypothetical protein
MLHEKMNWAELEPITKNSFIKEQYNTSIYTRYDIFLMRNEA